MEPMGILPTMMKERVYRFWATVLRPSEVDKVLYGTVGLHGVCRVHTV